jgi:hypothetical protein
MKKTKQFYDQSKPTFTSICNIYFKHLQNKMRYIFKTFTKQDEIYILIFYKTRCNGVL